MAQLDPRGNECVRPAEPYLLAWRLEGSRVVIVGGGAIGTGKVETLLATGADLTVIDPTPSARVQDLAAQGRLRLRQRRVLPTDLFRAVLVVAATGDGTTNRRVRRWAKPFGAVVNAVDDPANCDVTVPSVIRRGPATVAITTGGSTPAGARFLREELTSLLDEALPPEVADLLDGASEARASLRRRGTYRYDYSAWRQRFFEPGLAAVRAGRVGALPELRHRFEQDFEVNHGPLRPGQVTLVGAGPGGVDLITVRGAKALETADVVIYDRLADPALLNLAPVAAVRIPVGKAKGNGPDQGDISSLIVNHALAGSHVVRLKGGDPFVFGRGAEEIEAAAAAGLAVSLVPGVSSALGAPALAGISLTDRRMAASFTVLTGHRIESGDHDWEALAQTGSTLVVLMAATTAAEVAKRLLQSGRGPQEPVAFVHAAGTPEQSVATSDLESVAADGCPFGSPTVMVVGQVVGRIVGTEVASLVSASLG